MKVRRISIIINIILLIIIGVFFCSKNKDKVVSVKTKKSTKTTVQVKRKYDSLLKRYDSLSSVKQTVVYNKFKNTYRKNNKEVLKPNEKKTEAVVTNDTFKLKNATIVSTIFSKGPILQHNIKTSTIDSIINVENNTTKTIEKTRVESVFFLNIEPQISLWNQNIIGGNVSVDYTLRNKLRIGIGGGYNDLLPDHQKYYATIKIGIPLN